MAVHTDEERMEGSLEKPINGVSDQSLRTRAVQSIKGERVPLTALTVVFILFYYKFFLLGYLFSGADIINHWYQPWHSRPDLREQMPKNALAKKLYMFGERYNVGPIISRPGNPELSDPVFTYLPAIEYNIRTIKNGEMPLWNDTQLAGFNQLGDVTFSLFHPFNVLYFIPGLSIYQATNIRILLMSWLAGVFMLFLLRDFGVSRVAATAGAMTLMLCAQAVAFLEFISFMDAYAWMPLLYMLYRMYAREANGWYLVLGAVVATLIVLSRNPKPISYIFSFFAIYQFAHILYIREEQDHLLTRIKRGAIFGFFALGLGIAASMVTTLPIGGCLEPQLQNR